jgi:hypothetical protein
MLTLDLVVLSVQQRNVVWAIEVAGPKVSCARADDTQILGSQSSRLSSLSPRCRQLSVSSSKDGMSDYLKEGSPDQGRKAGR